ncbi:AMP-binding protein [Methylobacterium sp. NEAU K]|uniref:AMP-binding protein n=1 Tax=Methylobacterium sp. NEAU K TaxID=3064946 RepID=UPI0027377046|nr:AMP-binding protein [Methylobacterium sp. NEAU K]MDP4006220.1 AMP-binding protein [Methylobacterium sp. NEAU K]
MSTGAPVPSEKTSESRPAPAEAVLLGEIRALLAELHPNSRAIPAVDPGSDLARDLGLDSLGRAELLLRLARTFKVTLPDRLIGEAATPADLLAAIEAAGPARYPDVRLRSEVPCPPAEEPRQAETLIDVLAFHVGRHPDRQHLRLCLEPDRETVLTYVGLDRRARALAAGLRERGLGVGDRVALMLPTGPDFFPAFLGVLLAGGIPVPLYPPFRRSQIEDHLERQVHILGNAEPRILVAGSEIKAFADLLRDRVAPLREVVTPDDLASAAPLTQAAAATGATVALIQYTSGSTGDPKGVVLTHANLLANIRAMGLALGASSTDVVVSWLPLYHDMGLIGCWLGSFYYGAPAVIMPPLAFLADPGRWLRAIHRHRGTISAAPNFAYELCLKTLRDQDLAGLDLGSLRVLTNGSEPVSADTLARFAQRFGAFGLRPEVLAPVYGLAECAVGLAFPPLGRGPRIDRIDRDALSHEGVARLAGPDTAHPVAMVACGRPLPGHQIRVVDEAGRELPERVEGRLQFKGPSATAGYFRSPEKNRALFDGDWLNSGDLAYIAGGDVYVTGRTKDIIIRAGRKLYPQELEEIAGTVQGVRKGCVVAFASSDPKSGTERLVVVAETRLGDPRERDALRRSVMDRLAAVLEQPPDEVLLCQPHTVPKTSSGKIRRAEARARYEAGALARPAPDARVALFRMARAATAARLHRTVRRVTDWAYAASWWASLAAVAAPVWALVHTLPRRTWRHAALRAGARAFLRLTGTPPRVTGEPITPDMAAIVVANHASYLDAVVLTAILSGGPVFLAKQELAGQRVAGPFLRRLGTVFVHRGEEAGVADAAAVLDRIRWGERLVAFPEGTFTRSPGLLPFHLGAFQAACRAHIPVIPVTISGTRSILRADQWFPHRGAIGVHVGGPLVPEGEDFHAAVRLRDVTRAAILARSGEPDLADQMPTGPLAAASAA